MWHAPPHEAAFLVVQRWKSMYPGRPMPGLAGLGGPGWFDLGFSQQANAKLTARFISDSMRSCARRRV